MNRIFCAHCKQTAPEFKCSHCHGHYYCGNVCARLNYPVHIGVILAVQEPNIPPMHARIIPYTHREPQISIPYTMDTIRYFVNLMGGDTNALDKAYKECVEYRRLQLQAGDFDINPIVTTTYNKYVDTPANTYNLYRKPSKSGIIPYLVSPFISNSLFEQMLPEIRRISKIMPDQDISLDAKRVAWNAYIEFLSRSDDEYLGNWAFFIMTVRLKNRDSVFNDFSLSKTIYNAFMESYEHLKSRYSLKGKVEFPRVPTRFADLSIIPAGTFVYRGYADGKSRGGLSIYRTHDYFAFDFFTTSHYAASDECCTNVAEWLAQDSGIAVFKTVRTVRVLDLTKADTIVYMRQQMQEYGASDEVQKAFKFAWNISPAGSVVRRSDIGFDAMVVDWICSMGWDGYVGVGFDKFHDEILLCKPRETLELYQDLKHSRDFLNDFTSLSELQKEAVIIEY